MKQKRLCSSEERKRLTQENIPLAKWVTVSLWRRGQLFAMDSLDDALQEAYFALIKAIDEQDPEHPKASWTGYIRECIRRHLLRVNKENGIIHTPAWAMSKKTQKERPEVYQDATKAHSTASFDADVHESFSLMHVEDPSFGLQVEDLLHALERLPEYERDLIEVSFGLLGETKTLRTYAEEYGISHELARIRQQEVLGKLRERLEGVRWQKEAA